MARRSPPFVDRWILVLLTLGFGATLSPGSEPASTMQSSRPRIGLVLAGGGARGMAHIGVIRLLEELRVPVDFVAGTSMGSIVGGLYAAGYTSNEMVGWLEEADWDQLLSDSAPRPQRDFRTKAEEIETPRWIEMGIGRSGLKFPNAILSGQNLLFALRKLTSRANGIDRFDNLPVPFRAVATDVETGEMVVLDHGPLADAMRASMAVPGFFAPHTVDGRILIDGFASRNLPVSVAREMGVDVIIAVDLRPDLLRAEELNTPLAMVEQLMSILSQRDTIEQAATLGEQDVLLHMKLPGYSATSFKDGLTLVELGYEEAQPARTALSRLSVSATEYAAYQHARHGWKARQPYIADIEIDAGGRVVEAAIRHRLSVTPGGPLDQEKLEESLRRIYDLGQFQIVDYRVEPRQAGDVLVITARPKPWGPNFAIFGLDLGSDLEGSSELNIKTSLRFTEINRLGAELAIRGSLGTVDRLEAEFFQPVGHTRRFFVAPIGEYLQQPEQFDLDLTEILPDFPISRLDFERQTAFAGLDAGVRFGSFGEFRVGYERGSVRYHNVQSGFFVFVEEDGEIITIDPGSVLEDYTADRFHATLTLDRLDDAYFPESGYYLRLKGEREFGSRGSTTAEFFGTMPFQFGGVVLQPHLSINYTLEEEEGVVGRLPYRVGGLFNLSGLPTSKVFGSNSMVGALIARKRIGGGLFVGGSIEAGNAWREIDDRLPPDWIWAGSVFAASRTPIGPIHLAGGLTSDGDMAVYFYLGRILP